MSCDGHELRPELPDWDVELVLLADLLTSLKSLGGEEG